MGKRAKKIVKDEIDIAVEEAQKKSRVVAPSPESKQGRAIFDSPEMKGLTGDSPPRAKKKRGKK